MTGTHEKGEGSVASSLRRHRMAIAYPSNQEGRGFSDLTQTYWRSATILHRLAVADAAQRPVPVSPMIPSCLALYLIAADSLMNSVLGRVQLYVGGENLNSFCYQAACEPLSAKKIRKFLFILQIVEFEDVDFLRKVQILANIRGEIVHFVPVPAQRNEWRGRVLEAARAAGVSTDEMSGLDWSTAMSFVKIGNWCREIVLDLAAHIEMSIGWPPQLYQSDEAAVLGARTFVARADVEERD